MSVTVVYLITMVYLTVEANLIEQSQSGRGNQSALATSRLYLPEARLSPNVSVLHSAERYPIPTDWHCDSITQWRDLGESHYPRFVKQVRCSAQQCYSDFFSCIPQYYPLTVLKTRDRAVTSEEMALPLQLRNMWMFVQVHVSVACMCGA